MFRLEPRASAPLVWQIATPVLAVLATMLVGLVTILPVVS